MSDPIQATQFDGSDTLSEAYNYRITQDANGQVRLDTSDNGDIVELIWNDDKTLTIVINGKTAVLLNADQAKDVLIVTNDGDDTIFVTGDTPVGDNPNDYKLRLHGGDGNDTIIGSDGNEQLEGGNGSDRLWGMGGDDTLFGKNADGRGQHRDRAVDYLYGGDGDDTLYGHHGDKVHGNDGVDILHGGDQFANANDFIYDESNATLETDDELNESDDEEYRPESNAENIHYIGGGPSNAGAPTTDPAANDAELLPDDAEAEGSGAESAIDEPSATEPDATSVTLGPDLPSTLPGGGTAVGQVEIFHEQLTDFYADEIAQARENAQTYAENAKTLAESGDTEGAELMAQKALQQSARADQLLREAQARLEAAEVQLNEVLNDPAATDEQKATAQEQYDEAKLAVETAETQATEAADFAEEARVAAGLPVGADGSVETAADVEPESSESELVGEEPSATESDATSVTLGPDLPSTLPGGGTAVGQVEIFHEQLTDFYAEQIAQARENAQTYFEDARTAAASGDFPEAERLANMALRESARADQLLVEAQARLEAAEVQLNEVLNDPAATDEQKATAQEQYDESKLAVETAETQATEAAGFAEKARVAAGLPVGADGSVETAADVEPESSESELVGEEPSATESDGTTATPSPDLPSTLPGGDTAVGQVEIFHEQLTDFYAEQIAQARENAQTYSEDAQTAAASGDFPEAERLANMALRESARADQLLVEAQARLEAAEVQLNEVLNDPAATDEQKATAQEQYDEAKLAVETAETQATEAAGFAEKARVAAGLPVGADGSVETAEGGATEAGAEGSAPGVEGVEDEIIGLDEFSDDPYNEAMDNASEGIAQQENDRRTTRTRSGNFLLAIAEAMGLMQAKFLGNAMKNLDIMDSLSNAEIPEGDANAERQHREAFLVAQSKFQADMQMFNIVSQASATVMRSTGEGMAAVVRKN